MSTRSSASLRLILATLCVVLLAACDGTNSDVAAEPTSASNPPATPTVAPSDPPTASPTATASAASTPSFPMTIAAPNGEVVIDEQPTEIVSLSPTATEMLFAIGAGEQVVAVDDQSDFPEEAPMTDLSGFQPNVEAIAGYEPDLVIVSNDTTEEESLTQSLGELGIPVLLAPSAVTIDDTYEQIEQIGNATGNAEQAADLVEQMQTEIEQIVAEAPRFDTPPDIYHELDNTFYSVTSSTFIGSVYEMLGANNIADAADAGTDYPQLSAEFIVDAGPDAVFLADTFCCDVTAESVAQRPGWSAIPAVEEGNVVALPDDIPSRWGPRVVDFAQVVSDALTAVAEQ